MPWYRKFSRNNEGEAKKKSGTSIAISIIDNVWEIVVLFYDTLVGLLHLKTIPKSVES